MDFSIEEYSEEINLTIIEDGDLLEFSIEETVEEINLTIEEYNGADGIGLKGDKPDHEWNGTQLRFENPDDTWGEYVDLKGKDGLSGIQSVVAGDNITIDNTDPLNPIISAEEGGTNVTKTSNLLNDGEDGVHPFITAEDIPAQTPQVNTDWNATEGVAEILNKPDIPEPLPEGNLGDVLVKGAEDWEASSRLTDVELQIDAEQNKTASVVDKFLHYWDATAGKWISSGLKFVAGTINQLEFSGRIKADSIVLPSNSNPVVPNRFRSDGSRLKYANDASVEKDIAYMEDLANDNLLLSHVHNANISLQPTAWDYSTGYITVQGHGLSHSGQLFCGIFSTILTGGVITDYHPYYVVPYEYLTAPTYVKVIDANTLMICNVSGGLISVNPSQAQNLNRNDFTKWHVELFKELQTANISPGFKRISLRLTGVATTSGSNNLSSRYTLIKVFDNNYTPIETGMQGGVFSGNSFKNNIPFVGEYNIDIRASLPHSIGFDRSSYNAIWTTMSISNLIYGNTASVFPNGNNGVASFRIRENENWLANGTLIEIFRR